MIKLLKLDFKRAFFNKQFVIVALIGILLSITHFFTEIFPNIRYYNGGSATFSPFLKWISNDKFSIYSLLLFMILPILASIPYSDSYWIDKNSGFLKNIYTRAKKTDYILSKYITNFIVGGVSITLPLIVSLYLLFMSLPAINPSIFFQGDLGRNMFSSLFYLHPYMYILVYLFMSFMFGGVFASIGLAVSTYCKNKFLVVAIPTILYISMSILEIAGFPQLVPSKFLSAGQPVQNINIISIIMIFMILFICSLVLYIIGVNSDEII